MKLYIYLSIKRLKDVDDVDVFCQVRGKRSTKYCYKFHNLVKRI